MSTIPQSTTPRTDAAVRLTIGAGFNMVYPSFARELENELAEMSSIAEKWEDDALRYARNAEYWQTRAEKAEAELARLRSENNLLKAVQKISEEADEPFFREVLEARSILAAYDVAVKTRNHLKTELEVMTARAEKAEAELAEWSRLCRWRRDQSTIFPNPLDSLFQANPSALCRRQDGYPPSYEFAL